MTVRSLHIGQNYTGTSSQLAWCQYDAERMRDWVDGNVDGAEITFLVEQTRDQLADALATFCDSIGAGDYGVLTYSGHGTSVASRPGPDLEPDGRDECWVGVDGQLLTDDAIRARLDRAQGPIAVFSDSCNSGSVTRSMMNVTALLGGHNTRRYFPSPDPAPGLPLRGRIVPMTNSSPVILHAGCRDDEYSFETSQQPAPGGVFTTTLLKVWKRGMTHLELHRAIRSLLPTSQFPQHPQLFGGRLLRKTPVLP